MCRNFGVALQGQQDVTIMRVAFFPFRGNSSELHSRGGSSRRGGAFVPSGERKTMQRCVNPFQNSGAVAGPVQRDLIEKMVRGVPWMCVC